MITTASGGVLDEIRQRLTALAGTARDSGMVIRAPLLILGTCERVGSNWLSDALRPVAVQHNEPFRQQLSPAHPLSALNPGLSLGYPSGDLGTYGGHSLVTFAAAKHAPVRQVIKETNLFFALPALLALFPDSPAAVLTRSPSAWRRPSRAAACFAAGTIGQGTGSWLPWPCARNSPRLRASCPTTTRPG
jgi:hypothetical protein